MQIDLSIYYRVVSDVKCYVMFCFSYYILQNKVSMTTSYRRLRHDVILCLYCNYITTSTRVKLVMNDAIEI